jgi:opacity protein-like surface antigen
MRLTRLVGAGTALLAGLSVAPAASAQVLGLPVYNSGVPRGIGLYANVGFPNGDYGKGVAFGGTGRVGLGFIGASASVASYNPKGTAPSITSVGGTADIKVFGGPLVPLSVTLQGGLGYWKTTIPGPVGGPGTVDLKTYHAPIGLGIALSIPHPVLAIKPWIAPRLDIVHTSIPGTSNTDTHFGISGGVEFNLLSGLGAHLAYDWTKNGSVKPSVFEAGLHYTVRVPGL